MLNIKGIKIACILLLTVTLLFGCSGSPSDKILTTCIKDSMERTIPKMVIGNMLGAKLVSLEKIDIEKKEKKKWKPNSAGKMFGMKPYTYWDVTAVVKGTARLNEAFVSNGELRGFHARHIWRVRKNEEGHWYVNVKDDFSQQQPQQPADPHWWVISEANKVNNTE